MTPRVLVIGRQGQLARELARARWPDGWTATFTGRPDLDLQFPDKAAAFIEACRPNLVINAAAYTNVDSAENEPELARVVNAAGPAAIAKACAQTGAALIAISTDYVFDGTKAGPYREGDPVSPIGAYGRSKAKGEELIRAALDRHVILRTSWVFSPFGTNFVKTMVRLGAERQQLKVVADQHGCPTGASDLARAVIAVGSAVMSSNPAFGTFHVANSGVTTWYGLASAVFKILAARGVRVPEIAPIATAEYPTRAARPANSVLDCGRLRSTFGITLRPWRDALGECMDELLVQKTSA